MKIIFVNRYFHPDHSATSQFLSDLAFHLAKDGLNVSVITSTHRYDDPSANLAERESIMGVDVIRVKSSQYGRSGLKGRAIDYLTFYRGVHLKLLEIADENTLVVSKTDPPLLSLVCGHAVRKRGGRLVNWLQDFFPEVAVGVGMKLPGPVVASLRKFRDRSLRQAEANVVLSDAMASRAVAAGVEASRIHVIGNWGLSVVDNADTAKGDKTLRTEWCLGNQFVVGYSGNLGRVHDVETLLRGIEQTAINSNKNLTWLFIGGGAGMTRLRESVPMRAMDIVQFRDYLPLVKLPESLAVPDVHLVSLLPAMEGLVYPSKIAGILAAGKPMIFVGAKKGEIGTMIEREGCGIAVQCGDAEGLASAVAQLQAIPESREDMGRRARALYERKFARGPALDAWTKLMRSMAASQSHRVPTESKT
jgi:glycosyltransferase involved in cell wall biosynthesis